MTDIPRLNGAIKALAAGKPAFTTFSAPEIGAAQAIGAAAYDAVVFEMEHGPYDTGTLRTCISAGSRHPRYAAGHVFHNARSHQFRLRSDDQRCPHGGGTFQRCLCNQATDIQGDERIQSLFPSEDQARSQYDE